jgi:hypothetical protein
VSLSGGSVFFWGLTAYSFSFLSATGLEPKTDITRLPTISTVAPVVVCATPFIFTIINN